MASPAIPRGSLVLVTGVNGLVSSHVADQLLQAGYRVRGTARSEDKAALMKEVFHPKYGKDSFETVVVGDMAAENAFAGAVKDVSGVAHVASDLSFRPNPNEVVTPVLRGIHSILATAAAESSIKRFVLTSSSTALTLPKPGKKFHMTESTWNDEDVEIAWKDPPYEADRSWPVYAASKTQAEKACWDFVRDQKPGFVFNSILPNTVMGEILHPKQPASTAGWVRGLWEGDETATTSMKALPPQYHVDAKDIGRLHLAGLTDAKLQGVRLLGFTEPFNFNTPVDEMRKFDPAHGLPEKVPGLEEDLSTIDTSRAQQVLKEMGRPMGFTSLADSLRENMVGVKG